MLAILNSLNAHNLPIFQPILVILVSKFMVYRTLSDKTYLSLGLLSPLKQMVRFLYISSVQNGDILFWKFGSHFFYINMVVLINLGRFYLCAF